MIKDQKEYQLPEKNSSQKLMTRIQGIEATLFISQLR
jgi:hypothetical protein